MSPSSSFDGPNTPGPGGLPSDGGRRSASSFAPIVLRTHPKVLFLPGVALAFGLATAVAALNFLPALTDIAWVPLAAIGVVLVFLVPTCLVPALRFISRSFHIDGRRIASRSGVLYRTTTEIPISRITQVSCEQGILDRIFGCGTLVLADASAQQGGVRFHDVPRVRQVQRDLDSLIYSIDRP